MADTAHADLEGGESRRDFLTLVAGAMGAIGAAAAIWPFITSLNPARDTLAESTTEVDLAPIQLGQRLTAVWQGKPVFIAHRTAKEIEAAQKVDVADLRDPQPDSARVQKPEWLVVVGVCTHLGCIPLGQNEGDPRGPYGGWFCPCHGSIYDTSARIRQGPAPQNLAVPTYKFTTDHTVRIG
jgi:ubiquinol-cytochrome c reductase iron-sulfur subunit